MMALNLQPGDEVITASFTYVATAEVIALTEIKTCIGGSYSRYILL
jgi:UDP-2-acetamido-2-deoxy-ribo-hexuluronate aminotransferase